MWTELVSRAQRAKVFQKGFELGRERGKIDAIKLAVTILKSYKVEESIINTVEKIEDSDFSAPRNNINQN